MEVNITELTQQSRDYLVQGNPKCLKILSRCNRIAKETNNYSLLGYVQYSLAYWDYHILQDVELFRKHITKAVKYLLRSDNKYLLGSAYIFVATDADFNGSFDLAYQYYMTALTLNSDQPNSELMAVIEGNIARVLFQLGDYAEARKYFRKSIKVLNKHKNNPMYSSNIVIAYVGDGFNSLSFGDLEAAEKSKLWLDNFIEKNKDELSSESQFIYRFLKSRLALHNDSSETERLLNEVIKSLGKLSMIHECMGYMMDFVDDLYDKGHPQYVELLISSIATQIQAQDITFSRRLYNTIKVNYYKHIDDRERLYEALLEQNELLLRQSKEQKGLHKTSIDLIRISAELQLEQENIQKENELLHVQARTDGLTKLPNRTALNNKLEEAFHKAIQQKSLLAVGILDLDKFKEFNDSFGHQAGDACLETTGKILSKLAQKDGIFCARYGGDEFAIIYEGYSNQQIENIAKDLQKQIESSQVVSNKKTINHNISASQGIFNTVPDDINKMWDYISRADVALYSLKKNRHKKIKVSLVTEF